VHRTRWPWLDRGAAGTRRRAALTVTDRHPDELALLAVEATEAFGSPCRFWLTGGPA